MAAAFSSGEAYEPLMGRWSEMVARDFVKWVAVPEGASVLDVGCGTGALTRILLGHGAARVTGVDPSPHFIEFARSHVGSRGNVTFEVGDAMSLAYPDDSFQAVLSGLVLNFIPDKSKAIMEMVRVAKRGGVVASYVWDYHEKFEYARKFWDAARSVDPLAEALDEGRRFAFCRPEGLRTLFSEAGLVQVADGSIQIEMMFKDFAECWSPLLAGQGPIGGYLAQLNDSLKEQVRNRFQGSLRTDSGGQIRLTARAWTIRGTKPSL